MNIDKLLGRYTLEHRSVIFLFLDKLAKTTRKTGKISEPVKLKIIESFEAFDADVVIASLSAYLRMDIPAAKHGAGKSEKYVCGIMKNKQADKDAKAGDGTGGTKGHSDGGIGKGEMCMGGDEGERLQQLAGATPSRKLECDF